MSIIKNKNILESNIILEKRYLESKKLLIEDSSGTTKTNLQDLESYGVKLDDKTTHETILKQIQNTPLKVNTQYLKSSLGTNYFFNRLNNIISLTPEKNSRLERNLPHYQRTLTGEVINLNLPNGITLRGTYNISNNKPSQFEISKDINIGKKNVNLSLKTDVLNKDNQTQLGIKIPLGSN